MSGRDSGYRAVVRRARQLLRRGELERAERLVHRALALEPEQAEAFNLLGVLHELKREPLDAQKAYRAALSFESYAPSARNLERLVLHDGEGDIVFGEDRDSAPGKGSERRGENRG